MTVENIKKYTLTKEEISAIETTLEVIRALNWEGFDNYGDFYSSGLCIEDAQAILETVLENNDKKLEQRCSLFFFLFLAEHLFCAPGHRNTRPRGNITKKSIDK